MIDITVENFEAEVIAAKLAKPSGHPGYDAAVERARGGVR